MKKIINHGTMKLNNQLHILKNIREYGPVTRVELQKKTKLSWGTITSFTKELLEKGIVQEIGSVNTGVGRRPVELDMNIRQNFVLGLRIGSVNIRSVLLNVKGQIIDQLKYPVNADGSKEEILTDLFKAAEKTLEKNSLKAKMLAGIGIAAPGAVDFSRGICIYAPHHPNWKDVYLKQLFEDKYKVPCIVDHVSNCFALAEKSFGFGKDIDNFLCVILGTGISTGIVINGEVFRGADCASGEFGHTCINARGPECVCGSRGCLELYASGLALTGQGIKEAQKNKDSKILVLAGGKIENITAETVYSACRERDKSAIKIFKNMGFFLGIGVSNLINLFNPECIIISGRVSGSSEFFLPTLRKTIDERAWHASCKKIEISKLNNSGAMGSAALVLQEIYNTGLLFK